MRIFWSGAFAILMTAIVSGVWAALLPANLSHAPAFPWSSLVMALLLWALVAGLLWLVFLAGFWIVLEQLVGFPGNKLPDFSALATVTVMATLIMAAASCAVSGSIPARRCSLRC